MKKTQVICDNCKEDCNGLYTSYTIHIDSTSFHCHEKMVVDFCCACCRSLPHPDQIKSMLVKGRER